MGLLQIPQNRNPQYIAVTSTYAILTTDSVIDCISGTFTVTLPTAVGMVGKTYIIKNSGTGFITLATTSAQTIDGDASGSIIFGQYHGYMVMSNNVNWIVIDFF